MRLFRFVKHVEGVVFEKKFNPEGTFVQRTKTEERWAPSRHHADCCSACKTKAQSDGLCACWGYD